MCQRRDGRRPVSGRGPFARSPSGTINDRRNSYFSRLATGRGNARHRRQNGGTGAAARRQGPTRRHARPAAARPTRGSLEPEQDLMDRLRRMKPTRGALNSSPPPSRGAAGANPRKADHSGRGEVATGGADGKGELPAGPGSQAPFTKPAGLQPVRKMKHGPWAGHGAKGPPKRNPRQASCTMPQPRRSTQCGQRPCARQRPRWRRRSS